MGKPEKHVTIKEEPDDMKLAADGPAVAPWDAEEDHLLSYFLEGDAAVAAAARHRSDSDAAASAYATISSSTHEHHGTQLPGTHSHPTAVLPSVTMTPAVHFYPPPKPNTSLSSMASMAAALVGGEGGGGSVPLVGDDHDCEISPTAAMITNQSPENMLLPSGPQTEAEKQYHLAWLQHINAMATLARAPVDGMPGAAAAATSSYPVVYQQYHHQQQQQQPVAAAAVETEEKRARRLARNRESARQSRRRKKERLSTLEQKVTALFAELEVERRGQMMEMERQLQTLKSQELEKLDASTVGREELQRFLEEMGPNSKVRERVATFQYEKLRQLLLPRHEEFVLWLTLQQDSFFNSLKDKRAASSKTGRVSSKQIGEELSNEFNNNNNDEDEKLSTNDLYQIWPLFCFEHLVSVEQEEKLIQTSKRIRNDAQVAENRLQMALATKMVDLVKKGVLFQAHAASMRTRTTLLEILTPEQSVKFLKYMAENRPQPQSQSQTQDATLEDVCKRLDEVLRLG